MKKSLMMAALLLLSLTAKAVPAYPAKRVVTTKSGETLVLTLRGDEHFSYFTDEAGQPYQMNAFGEYIPITKDEVATVWGERLLKANARRTAKARTRSVGDANPDLKGKKKGLVILMDFQDQRFSTDNAKAVYQDFFNKEGYSDYGMTGSVKDYFKAQSYGDLEIDFDVVGPFTASQKESYYGAPVKDKNGNKKANDQNPMELINEACRVADSEVNYVDYDWDGDGEVDQVFVIYAGYGENYGADENTIWPHEYHLAAGIGALTLDGVKVDTYACSCELRGTKGTDLDGIGAACHEFSHCLGLPDFYDTSGSNNYGTGTWDIMNQGNYNNNSCTPAGYTSYERMFAGWITPIELTEMTRVEGMKPLSSSKEAYILYNEGNRNEYYLLENRQKDGFDASLSGHGLLVLHVDYNAEDWRGNTVNTNPSRQKMTIIAADGKLNYSNESSDPFPGPKGVTELTNYTTPAATLYNENTDGTKFLSKPIDNIKESEDGLISFVACRPELDIPEPGEGTAKEGDNEFTVTWPAVSGAISYELELTEMGTASDNPEDALVRAFDFKEFESDSNGRTDISSKMGDYGLKGWSGSKIFTSPAKMRIGTSSSAGYVKTPNWYMTASSEVTIVIGGDIVKEGSTIKGKVIFKAYNVKETGTESEEQSFEISGNTKLVFNFSTRKEAFWIEIRPDIQMSLNYFAIYDGTWNAEQLGIANQNSSRQMSPRKTTTVTTYTTDTNSYTFKDLNTSSRFLYRVRAIGEENTYSKWSEEKAFSFSGSNGISNVSIDSSARDIYDLRGRRLGTDINSLRKGIYIIGGKKIMK